MDAPKRNNNDDAAMRLSQPENVGNGDLRANSGDGNNNSGHSSSSSSSNSIDREGNRNCDKEYYPTGRYRFLRGIRPFSLRQKMIEILFRNNPHAILAALESSNKEQEPITTILKRRRKILGLKLLHPKRERSYCSCPRRHHSPQHVNLVAVASATLRDDKQFMMQACQQRGMALQYASERLLDDRDLVLAVCARCLCALQFASDRLQYDKQIALGLGKAFITGSEDFWRGRGVIDLGYRATVSNEKVESLIEGHISTVLKGDKDFLLEACQLNPLAFQYGNEEMRNDKDLMLAAGKSNALMLQYGSPTLKDDAGVVLELCKQRGIALQYASRRVRDELPVVLQACKQDGYALKYASQRLQNHKDVVLGACQQYCFALQFASETLRDDSDVVLAACAGNRDNGQGNIHSAASAAVFSVGGQSDPGSEICF